MTEPGSERRGWVVDASVVVKLFVEEPLSDRAQDLLDQLAADPRTLFYLPDLLYVECTNILWKHVRRFGFPIGDAHQALANLRSLAVESFSTADLLNEALEIALAHDVTAYDACYVALSHNLALPLVTADERLVRKLADTPYSVRWLGDLSPPSVPSP